MDETDSQFLGYRWLPQQDLRTESIDSKDPLFGLKEIYSGRAKWAGIHHIFRMIVIQKSIWLTIRLVDTQDHFLF